MRARLAAIVAAARRKAGVLSAAAAGAAAFALDEPLAFAFSMAVSAAVVTASTLGLGRRTEQRFVEAFAVGYFVFFFFAAAYSLDSRLLGRGGLVVVTTTLLLAALAPLVREGWTELREVWAARAASWEAPLDRFSREVPLPLTPEELPPGLSIRASVHYESWTMFLVDGIAPDLALSPRDAPDPGAAEGPEQTTGDSAFDSRVRVRGGFLTCRTVLDRKARDAYLAALASLGARGDLRVANGTLRNRVPKLLETSGLTWRARRLLELARRLRTPDDHAARLAAIVAEDRDRALRLKALDLLVGRFAQEPVTLTAARSALTDADPEVRLHAASSRGRRASTHSSRSSATRGSRPSSASRPPSAQPGSRPSGRSHPSSAPWATARSWCGRRRSRPPGSSVSRAPSPA